jgi:hypothetical protein
MSQRHLFFGLVLMVALVLAVGVPAVASTPSTLTGENLSSSSSQGGSGGCPIWTYTVSGTAAGPYPGTFTETGTSTITPGIFSATFTIRSGTTTVTGSKDATAFVTPGLGGNFICSREGGTTGLTGVPYTATVHTVSGNFRDQGVASVQAAVHHATATLTESFTSSLAEPVLIAPTGKDDCKNDGWKGFPQFRNQGQCVSFVESKRGT